MSVDLKKRPHLFVKEVRLHKKSPPISLELRPQVHAIVARSEEQGENFVRCAAGIHKPPRGRMLLGEAEPGKTPELRARIGSLLRREPPLVGPGTVRQYLAHLLALRHQSAKADGPVPEPTSVPYVAELLERPAVTLTNRERRQLALGLALSVPRPLLLVLFDPLFELDAQVASNLLERFRTFAEDGTIVACVVPTERGARQLSERIHHLEPTLDRDREVLFLIRSERPRDVASSLAKSRHITATKIRSNGDLIVSANSEDPAAGEITQALASTQVEVFEVRRIAALEISNGA